jgi:hypothetical protein
MLGEHREVLRGEERGCPAAGDHRHGDTGLLEERQRALEEIARVRIAIREGHEPLEAHLGESRYRAGQIERLVRRLHAGAAEAGIALDQEAHVGPGLRRGLGQFARDDVVVEDHREAAHALDQRHQAVGLLAAEDVVGEEDVVGDSGVDEHLDLADLLTRDADGSRLHLYPSDRRDLVRLDVRPIADGVPREMRLNAADVVAHDVEVDGDNRRVEVRN